MNYYLVKMRNGEIPAPPFSCFCFMLRIHSTNLMSFHVPQFYFLTFWCSFHCFCLFIRFQIYLSIHKLRFFICNWQINQICIWSFEHMLASNRIFSPCHRATKWKIYKRSMSVYKVHVWKMQFQVTTYR